MIPPVNQIARPGYDRRKHTENEQEFDRWLSSSETANTPANETPAPHWANAPTSLEDFVVLARASEKSKQLTQSTPFTATPYHHGDQADERQYHFDFMSAVL